MTTTKTATSVDVVYVANIKPGDVTAADVNRDAPTRPVSPYACALEVRRIEKDDEGYRFFYSDDPMTPLYSSIKKATDQVVVIRP